jgi:hypothetical protein
MSKPLKQLRYFDEIEATPLWRSIQGRTPGPEIPPPVRPARRVMVAVTALALFAVAALFAWSAFGPGDAAVPVGSSAATPLVGTLDAPADGTIPGLTLEYGGERHDYFAQGGHWPGVNGFNQPFLAFPDPLATGTSLEVRGDASQVVGNLEVLDQNYHDTGTGLSLDLLGGSATLPETPGFYQLNLTGTWPQGTASFYVGIHIVPPPQTTSPDNGSGSTGTPELAATIQMPRGTVAGGIAVGAGSVWVGVTPTQSGGQAALVRIDPSTNTISGSLELPHAPFREQIAPTDDAIWIAVDGQIQRVDPVSMDVIASIPIPGGAASAVVADATGVWAADPGDHEIVRIDPGTNSIAARIPVGNAISGYADHLRLGFGSVWVVGPTLVNSNTENGGNVVRIDEASDVVQARIPLGGFFVVIGPDGAWVKSPMGGVFDSSTEQWVWRVIDPSTNTPSAAFKLPADPDVVTPDAIWSAAFGDDVRVGRLDPTTLNVVAKSDVIAHIQSDAAFDLPSDTAWVSSYTQVLRVDLGTS